MIDFREEYKKIAEEKEREKLEIIESAKKELDTAISKILKELKKISISKFQQIDTIELKPAEKILVCEFYAGKVLLEKVDLFEAANVDLLIALQAEILREFQEQDYVVKIKEGRTSIML